MNKSRFAENQLTRMCQAVLSSQKTACILRTSLVLTIFMEQREECLSTLQFFFLMINRNTILFTQFLCSILMHWILPCIDTCSLAVPTDDTTHSWATGVMIKMAFFRGVLWKYALKKPQTNNNNKKKPTLFLRMPVTTDPAADTALHAGMAPIHTQMGSWQLRKTDLCEHNSHNSSSRQEELAWRGELK